MDYNTALFLCTAIIASGIFFTTYLVLVHQRRMKALEIEKLKIEKANLHKEVEEVVEKKLKDHASRIEVLEAIVTDKNYDLSDKITRLK